MPSGTGSRSRQIVEPIEPPAVIRIAIFGREVRLGICREGLMKDTGCTKILSIVGDHISDSWPIGRPLPIITFCRGSPPTNFILKIRWRKDTVHEHLEVVASGRVTVQIDTARWLQHPS